MQELKRFSLDTNLIISYKHRKYDFEQNNCYLFPYEQRLATTRETVCGPYTINKNGLMCMSSVS